MMHLPPHLRPLAFLVAATALEITGDALVRKGIFNYTRQRASPLSTRRCLPRLLNSYP